MAALPPPNAVSVSVRLRPPSGPAEASPAWRPSANGTVALFTPTGEPVPKQVFAFGACG